MRSDRPAPRVRSRRHPRALAGAVAAVAILTTAPAAVAHAEGGLLIAPSSVDARVQGGTVLRTIHLSNRTTQDLVVGASARVAHQELTGLPVYGLDAAARRAGRAFVRVSPAHFVLPAGTTRQITTTVVARHPQIGRGGYGVVLFQAVPRTATHSRNAVTTRLRLTANLLFTYPSRVHPAVVHGVAKGLRAEQGPARTLRFLVRVNGAGTIHGRPRTRLRVRDARGRVVGRAHFTTGNVLPGADRELPAILTTPLPAGDYTARATVHSGGRSTATLRFHLVGEGVLPTPDLRIVGLPVPHPDAGHPFSADVQLRNRGTAPAPVHGWWQLRSEGGQALLAHGRLSAPPLGAGARRTDALHLPKVRAGRWRLVVALDGEGRELDRRELAFGAGTQAGWFTRFEDWAAGHIPVLLAGFALILLLVAGAATAYVLRLRRAVRAA